MSQDKQSTGNRARILELHAEGLNTAQIRAELGISRQRVNAVLAEYGKNARISWDARRVQVDLLNRQNLSMVEIAKQLKVSVHTIRQDFKVLGAKRKQDRMKERNIKIRELAEQGLSAVAIASKVGVKGNHIYGIMISLGISVVNSRKVLLERVARRRKQVRVLHRRGLTTQEIAKQLSVHAFSIHNDFIAIRVDAPLNRHTKKQRKRVVAF